MIDEMIKENSENIKVEGHRGTWYVVDSVERYGIKYFLLEHEIYGEDADGVIIDENGELIMEDVSGGFDELDIFLCD